ncbi:MAG: single-stranded DNA-binding protein [Rickettsia endosymbiont of Bryobia graminum]|nr:single-stranded DNA-binding protein [Rickettsia endosymbiont of Bryobia graminum]
MANSLNRAILIGNLGRDPEIRSTNDGKEIASFSIATSETWKDRVSGERKEKTEWHRVVVFNEGLVSVIKNYAKKGTKVYIEGSLQTRKWIDNSGQEKYTTEIVLQNFNSQFILLDSKAPGTGSTDSFSQKTSTNNSFDHSDLDDEIPF